jgi:copper homeostasis protein (lipoprotein)
MLRSLLALIGAFVTSLSAAGADEITGQATLPKDAAAPADGVFFATLSDTSLADAPAKVLGRFEGVPAGAPPYEFVIPYDSADSIGGQSFTVSAALHSAEGRLLFTSNTANPVIANGETTVDVSMITVAAGGDTAEKPVNAVGLRLPATFSGTLPCADCEGIEYALNLWPNGGFHMTKTWLGATDDLTKVNVGTWHADPSREAVVLYSGDDAPVRFEVVGIDTLRLLARDGSRIESELNYNLTSEGGIRDLDLTDIFFGGVMTLVDDVPFLEECFSGRAFPIARGGQFEALKEARDENGTDRLFVQIEAEIAMNPEFANRFGRSISVVRFVRARPELTCERQRATSALFNTYWRVDTLRGDAQEIPNGGREPHIVMTAGDPARYRATYGCNLLVGTVRAKQETLSFEQGLTTLKVCPPPFEELERDLASVMSETRTFRKNGDTLLLMDEDDSILSILTAVYLQ